MSRKIIPLAVKAPRRAQVQAAGIVLHTGRRYLFSVAAASRVGLPHGLLGGYHISLDRGACQPPDLQTGSAAVYIYDSDARPSDSGWQPAGCTDAVAGAGYRIVGNRADLTASDINGPEIIALDQRQRLSMRLDFRLRYATDDYTASLGVLHLLQSQRTLLLRSGQQWPLLACTEPRLYRHDPAATEPVVTICPCQAKGGDEEHAYRFEVGQDIPSRLADEQVESVTVLEQYQSYFMQRECAEDGVDTIWTPILPPVSWGWSIRVGRRADHEWAILRRKLVQPRIGHDGLELPQWQASVCRL